MWTRLKLFLWLLLRLRLLLSLWLLRLARRRRRQLLRLIKACLLINEVRIQFLAGQELIL